VRIYILQIDPIQNKRILAEKTKKQEKKKKNYCSRLSREVHVAVVPTTPYTKFADFEEPDELMNVESVRACIERRTNVVFL
jgi:hypothetical protein